VATAGIYDVTGLLYQWETALLSRDTETVFKSADANLW